MHQASPPTSHSNLLQRAWWVPIALLSITIAAPRIFGEHWPSDSPYYQAIATQMARSGNGPGAWWSPMQGALHYFNKPPLAFWIHGALVAAFGDADWAARAPEAAFFLFTCLLVGWLARRLHGAPTGLLAGCLLALTSEWVRCVGNFRLEFLHTLLLLSALACWVKAFVPYVRARGGTGGSPPVANRPAFLWSSIAGLCIGLALMTKPLIGLAFPFFGLAWLWLSGLLTRRAAASILLSTAVAVVIALPWHASMLALYGEPFARSYFWEQSLKRATGEMFQTQPWDWYFRLIAGGLPESIHPALMWPIYAGALAGLAVIIMRRQDTASRAGDALALLWTLAWFIALCAFSGKLNYYLLVVHPGAAWLSAIALVALIRVTVQSWSERALQTAARSAASLALLAYAALVAVYPRAAARTIEHLPTDQQALMGFLADHRSTPIYNCGLPYTEAALVYLKTGIWPRSLVEKQPVPPDQVPTGALMVYREDHPATPSADPADPEVFAVPVGGSAYTVRERHNTTPFK